MRPVEWLPQFKAARRALVWKSILSVLLIAALAAAGTYLGSWVASRPRRRQQAIIDAEVSRLEGFVEHARGLSFRRPVQVRLLSDRQFDSLDDTATFLRIVMSNLYPAFKPLGLETGPNDPGDLAEAMTKSELGLYNHDVVSVRGTTIDPFTRRILVHELTHALDDQNYPFDEGVVKEIGFRPLAVDALIEGDASRVENMYLASLSPRDRLIARPPRRPNPTFPSDLLELLRFPYDSGRSFVTYLAHKGGETAVDRAFDKPPLSDTEVLHPDEFNDEALAFAIDDIIDRLPVPKPTGKALGVIGPKFMGELLTRIFLEPAIGKVDAAEAASAWTGDQSITWSNGTQDCIRIWYARPKDPRKAALLLHALERWARTQPHARAESNPIGLTSCN